MKIYLKIWSVLLCFKISNSEHSSTHTSDVKSNNWAFLVAGSFGYDNYRHQADICHAYQIIRAGGIPEEQIIVMMVDDIAYNKENPTPGIILNTPNGTNVYEGVKIDYRGDAVTPTNFFHILNGDSEALRGVGSGKVIKSGPNDIVFVNFVDHGARGLLTFPEDILTAGNLSRIVNSLSEQRKFHMMVIFVEASFSGSMFVNVINETLNVVAVTAADDNEPSISCYWDDKRQTYLGDLFSVTWMHLAENKTFTRRSLNHLYEEVRAIVFSSHAQEYGNLDLGPTPLFHILGNYSTPKSYFSSELEIHLNNDAVSSLDVPLHILHQKRKKVSHLADEVEKIDDAIRTILRNRKVVKNVMDKIVKKIAHHNSTVISLLQEATYSIDKNILDCYDNVLLTFSKSCFNIAKNPYVTRYLQMLVNACHMYLPHERRVLKAIKNTCKSMRDVTGIV